MLKMFSAIAQMNGQSFLLQAVKCIQKNVRCRSSEKWWQLLLGVNDQKHHKKLMESNSVNVQQFI